MLKAKLSTSFILAQLHLHEAFNLKTILMPFLFQDDGSSRVFVVEAQYASGFEYTFKKEVVDNVGRSLVTGTLDNHLGRMVSHILIC